MPGPHRAPIRTCVGCRTTAAKSELVRLVWNGGVVLDVVQTAPGRGAYLHRRAECIQQALRRRALGRALRQPHLDQLAVAAAVAEICSGQGL